MTAARGIARRAARGLGLLPLALRAERRLARRRHVVVLTYHHVARAGEADRALSRLQGGIPEATFAAQVEAMRRWYRPMTIAEVEAVAAGAAPLREDGFLVTFDDAYASVREVAGPHLRRLGVPGHVFVATAFVESPRRFWWVRFVDWMGRADAGAWGRFRDDPGAPPAVAEATRGRSVDAWGDRREASRALLAALDPMGDADREAVLAAMEATLPPPDRPSMPVLTWAAMRAMRGEGFTFGGHTHTHPRLPRIAPERAREELATGGAILGRELGERPTSFAYPSGDCSEEAAALVAEAGYAVAFTTRPGAIGGASDRPRELPRVTLGPGVGPDLEARILGLKMAKRAAPRAAAAGGPRP